MISFKTPMPAPVEAPVPNKVREVFDDYPTPMPWAIPCARAVYSFMTYKAKHVLDPSAGAGNFLVACRSVFSLFSPTLHANELQGKHQTSLQSIADYVTVADWEFQAELEAESRFKIAVTKPELLIIGNPPFALAERHIKASMKLLVYGEYCAQLLRLNFLEGKRRALEFFPGSGLKYILPFDGRPKFRENKNGVLGTDRTAYAMFIFEKGYVGNAEIPIERICEER